MNKDCGQKRITMIDVMRAAGADEKTCENLKLLDTIAGMMLTMDPFELNALHAMVKMLKAHESAAKENIKAGTESM